jgi:flagellar protein FliS
VATPSTCGPERDRAQARRSRLPGMNPYRRPGGQQATAYRSAEIATLTQRDLLVRLYQGMERFLIQAKAAMDAKDWAGAHHQCQRAKEILNELVSTLDFEHGGEVAEGLKRFYLSLLFKISEANLRKSPAVIDAVLPLLARVREAWEQVPAEMANSGGLAAAGQSSAVDIRS